MTDEDDQIKAAIGAVMSHYGEGSDEWDQLSTELQHLGRFNAAMTAVDQGVGVDWESIPDGFKAVGILRLWHETAPEAVE